MNDYDIFDKYTFIPEKAASYGFNFSDDKYIIRKPLRQDGFYAVFSVNEKSVDVDVYEEPGELYLPFHATADTGGFVSTIRSEVDEIMDDILKNCFELADVKAILLDYVGKKYGTIPEAPWGYLKEYHTLNTEKRHKWYGLFMLIPYKYLGIEKEGKINVLNLKADPEKISSLVDNVRYYPAYHMNKKYWISIPLDKSADIERIKSLLDESYKIVEGK